MDRELNREVFLLKMLKKEPNESIKDVILSLSDTGLFTPKEGKRIKKELESLGYILNGDLTLKGLAFAKEIEKKFKL